MQFSSTCIYAVQKFSFELSGCQLFLELGLVNHLTQRNGKRENHQFENTL